MTPKNESGTGGESNVEARLAELNEIALKVFGSEEAARRWMSTPQWALGGAVPLEYARTKAGAQEVENLMGRIQYGVYS